MARDACELPELLVIRHAETQWNVGGRIQGRCDTPLTLNGVRQAMAVATALRDAVSALENAQFWVSPLGRARQTASILADMWSTPFTRFIVEPRIAERNYGRWEGKTLAEIDRDFPEDREADAADPWRHAIAGGESREALDARLRLWLAGLDRARRHVVVTHSGCLRALRGLYTGAPLEAVLAYREAQTSSFRLSGTNALALDVPPEILERFGCVGAGETVRI